MNSYDEGRFEKYKEFFIDNKCVFEGKLKYFYKDLSDESIFYCINGGGMIRDGNIKRNGLYFQGSYYFPKVNELKQMNKNELLKVYILPKYKACKNECIRKANKEKEKSENYVRYVYYAKTKFGDIIHQAYSLGRLAEKMNVSDKEIQKRKNKRSKNSWYVDFEKQKNTKINHNKKYYYDARDKNGNFIARGFSYNDLALKLNVSSCTIRNRVKNGLNGKIYNDYNVIKMLVE